MLERITVKTNNFKVQRRFYEFDYMLYRNGKIATRGHYANSHSRSVKYMKKVLNTGYATELVLERYL